MTTTSPSRPVAPWLKWGGRVLGALAVCGSLASLPFTGIALWLLLRSKEGPLAHSGQLLAQVLGRLTGELIFLFLGIWLLRWPWKKKSKTEDPAAARVEAAEAEVAEAETVVQKPVEAATPVASPASAAKRWHSCTVLKAGAEARQLWQFDARNGGFALNREQTSLSGEALPSHFAGKDWRTLFQPKLNVAWLPPEHVFLRVAQFPRSAFDETVSMVELQLEKLSPLPLAQIVWSFHVLPHAAGNMQTVIVVIVARNVVEEFLGELEGQGYLADRLELPVIDQLQATAVTGDGAWVYPEAIGGKNSGLAAWWYGGVLQNVDIVTLPAENRSSGLGEQLTQMAWAGELEGWLTSPPRWHLVANSSVAAEWESALRAAVEQPVEIIAPLPGPELAALTARRAAQAPPRVNLLPAEFSTRYQQQFVDRLWMRGLLAIGALYLLGVAIYATALGFAIYRTTGVEKEAASKSQSYTNAIQLKAIYQVMLDRKDLKFAALECWKAVAEVMPETISLESWNFGDGKKLSLAGSVPVDQVKDLRDFARNLRNFTKEGQPMFERGLGDDLNYRATSPGTYGWTISVELKKGEEP